MPTTNIFEIFLPLQNGSVDFFFIYALAKTFFEPQLQRNLENKTFDISASGGFSCRIPHVHLNYSL
jgi:hypothetical protein